MEQEIVNMVDDRVQAMLHLLQGRPGGGLAHQPLGEQLVTFERVLQRPRGTCSAQEVQEIETAVRQLLALLGSPVDITPTPIVPPSFWTRSRLGQVLAHVTWWLYHDDLISITAAAHLLYERVGNPEFLRIRRLIERGALQAYVDPGEPNPQRASRVRRSAVMEVKQHMVSDN